MMNHLPDRLDLYAAAEAGRVLQGRLRVARLERALPLLASRDGELEVLLEAGRDEDGMHYLAGWARGILVLQCQRCLDPIEYALNVKFRLGLVQSEGQVQRLSSRYEPLLTDGGPTELVEVITDEVLLALPIVPRHSGLGPCRPPRSIDQPVDPRQAGGPRENPFAVLAQLKQKP